MAESDLDFYLVSKCLLLSKLSEEPFEKDLSTIVPYRVKLGVLFEKGGCQIECSF